MGGLSKFTLALALFFSVSAHSQQCVSLFSESTTHQNQIQKTQLKVGTYNLLNLFLHSGNIHKGSAPHAKPRWAAEEIASILQVENYDIFVAQEVESIGSAKRFNEQYLGDQYHVFSTTTKDVRGLFVVFFVKKSLPFAYKMESHSEEVWFDPIKQKESLVFERDLPTLHIYKNKSDDAPIMTMIGAHLKSKRSRYANKEASEAETDKESALLRTAQVNRAVQIIQKYQMKFGYNHPILVAGDFNSNHNFAPEFVGFSRYAKLVDTLGLKKEIQKYSDRTTHSYFGGEKPRYSQLDGILVTASLANLLEDAYVVPYRDESGNAQSIPKTKDDRKKNPSDHRPVTAVFSI